jgi:hypothetical protein
MQKLTDTQLIVLSNAAAREDGAAVIPERMNRAAAARVSSSLVARKLMREVRSKLGVPVWHDDGAGRRTSLIITRAGRDAIGVKDEKAVEEALAAKRQKAGPEEPAFVVFDTPRPGSKQAIVIEMLSCNKGATIEALVEATGWLPHTTRAVLTGLRKRGFSIVRTRGEGEPSVYRIVLAKV